MAEATQIIRILCSIWVGPFEEVLGLSFCSAHFLFYQWSIGRSSYLTFFVTIFRYVCIFKDDLIFRLRLTPRKLARFMAFFQTIAVTLILFLLIIGSSRSHNKCSWEVIREQPGAMIRNILCNSSNLWLQTFCKGSLALHFVLSTNLAESYLLYCCFKGVYKCFYLQCFDKFDPQGQQASLGFS